MNKLLVSLLLLAVAAVAGTIRLAIGDANTDGLVLLILAAGVPGVWLLASHIDDAAVKRSRRQDQ
jgi:uncharacterized membrane protein YqjE